MDWPHDPDGDEGSEGGRKYGLAVFAKKLGALEFPVDAEDCLEAFGDHPVRIDHARVVAAADVLEAIDDGPYETREALLAALGAAMRRRGWWTLEAERYASG
ncbi:MAG: DUF5785 family protein [Halobacteriales archaeon]